jgi:prophage regulatory protein
MNTDRYELRQALNRVVDALVDALAPQEQPSQAPQAAGSYLTSRDVAERVQVSTSTIYRWMEEGRFPRPALHLSSQQPRWAAEDVDAWEHARKQP